MIIAAFLILRGDAAIRYQCGMDHHPPNNDYLALPTLDAIARVVRTIVREEMAAMSNQRAYAAINPMLTLDETCEYLKMSRATITRARNKRKLAKTQAEKDLAFPADRHKGNKLFFARADLDAWLLHN